MLGFLVTAVLVRESIGAIGVKPKADKKGFTLTGLQSSAQGVSKKGEYEVDSTTIFFPEDLKKSMMFEKITDTGEYKFVNGKITHTGEPGISPPVWKKNKMRDKTRTFPNADKLIETLINGYTANKKDTAMLTDIKAAKKTTKKDKGNEKGKGNGKSGSTTVQNKDTPKDPSKDKSKGTSNGSAQGYNVLRYGRYAGEHGLYTNGFYVQMYALSIAVIMTFLCCVVWACLGGLLIGIFGRQFVQHIKSVGDHDVTDIV